MIPFVGRHRWINCYIYPAAGCFEANKWVNAVCDLEGDDMDMDMDMDNPSQPVDMVDMDNPSQPVDMDMDKSRFCSGLCNAALKSTSTGCDAKDAVEATVKTVADDALQHCSGCSAFYYEYLVACDVADDGERAPVRSLTRFIMCCIYGSCSARAPAHGTHSHTRPRLTSARAPSRCGCYAQRARAPGPVRLRLRRKGRLHGGRLQRRVQLRDQVCVHWLRCQ